MATLRIEGGSKGTEAHVYIDDNPLQYVRAVEIRLGLMMEPHDVEIELLLKPGEEAPTTLLIDRVELSIDHPRMNWNASRLLPGRHP